MRTDPTGQHGGRPYTPGNPGGAGRGWEREAAGGAPRRAGGAGQGGEGGLAGEYRKASGSTTKAGHLLCSSAPVRSDASVGAATRAHHARRRSGPSPSPVQLCEAHQRIPLHHHHSRHGAITVRKASAHAQSRSSSAPPRYRERGDRGPPPDPHRRLGEYTVTPCGSGEGRPTTAGRDPGVTGDRG